MGRFSSRLVVCRNGVMGYRRLLFEVTVVFFVSSVKVIVVGRNFLDAFFSEKAWAAKDTIVGGLSGNASRWGH